MGVFDRIGRVIRANVNSLINQAEDPEKVLEQTVMDMQNDLIQLRQAVAQAIATQKRTERQQSQTQATAEEWYRRAQLALQKNDDPLAREALTRRKSYQDTADALKVQIEQQSSVVIELKQNMVRLESKLSEARTKKDMYIARARSAKASERLNEMLGQVGNSSAMAAFERMEERVLNLEARSQAVRELSNGDEIENRFKTLESGTVEEDLALLKAQMASGNLPSSSSSLSQRASAGETKAVDAELERLRSKLEGS